MQDVNTCNYGNIQCKLLVMYHVGRYNGYYNSWINIGLYSAASAEINQKLDRRHHYD